MRAKIGQTKTICTGEGLSFHLARLENETQSEILVPDKTDWRRSSIQIRRQIEEVGEEQAILPGVILWTMLMRQLGEDKYSPVMPSGEKFNMGLML